MPNTPDSRIIPMGEVSGRSGSHIKTRTGVGVVKKAGDRELVNLKLADGSPDPASEGFYRWSRSVPETIDEVYAWFQQVDAKGKLVNAVVVKNDSGEKVTLDAEACIVEVVAAMLADEAKSNAYQKTLAKFKPAEDPKAAFEKIVRGFMSLGLPEDLATAQAQAAIDANAAREAEDAAEAAKA